MFIQILVKYHPPISPFEGGRDEGAGMKNTLNFVYLNIQFSNTN